MSTSLCSTSCTFALNPMEFLARWQTEGNPRDAHLLTSRLSLDVIVKDCFGDLLDTTPVIPVSQLLTSCAIVLSEYKRAQDYQSPKGAIDYIVELLPELEPLRNPAISHWERMHANIERKIEDYKDTSEIYGDGYEATMKEI